MSQHLRAGLGLGDVRRQLAGGSNGFLPTDTGKASGWLRLAASQQSGGEWTPSIVDILNPGNPVTQTDTDRRSAVGASANGLPTMVFDGSDVHVWPLNAAINNMATKLGLWFWFKPASLAAVQSLFPVRNGTGGASTRKLDIRINTDGSWTAQIFVDGTNGRALTTGAGRFSVGAWTAGYFRYDSSVGGDGCVKLYTLGVDESLSGANLGTGGTLGALMQPTGNMLIGGTDNTDTPGSPILSGGEIGPGIVSFNDNLTADDIANMVSFERPAA